MGLPTLFKKIIDNKYYKNIHRGIKNGQTNADYFFMDYNGIVYNAYENIKKDIEKNDYTKDKIEELVLEEVDSCTKDVFCEVIKPKNITNIALDGPEHQAKMVHQRARRMNARMAKNFVKA